MESCNSGQWVTISRGPGWKIEKGRDTKVIQRLPLCAQYLIVEKRSAQSSVESSAFVLLGSVRARFLHGVWCYIILAVSVEEVRTAV